MTDSLEKNSILVIRLGALGDIVQSFPIMQALRQRYVKSRIVFMTTPPFKPFLESSPYFDDIWTIRRWSWTQVPKWVELARDLRARNFAHVYDLQRNDRSLIMSYLVPRALQQKWYGKKGSPHIPVLGELCYENIPGPDNIDTSWLDADITKYRLPPRYAILVPGCSSGHLYKRWPAQNYAKTVNNLRALGIASVLIGTAAEREVLDRIKHLAPSVINLCDQTDLHDIAEIARHAKVAIGNDTGPMHLIGIVGCPVVSLFSGKTSPEKSKPIGRAVITLQSYDISHIDPASVFEATSRLIQ